MTEDKTIPVNFTQGNVENSGTNPLFAELEKLGMTQEQFVQLVRQKQEGRLPEVKAECQKSKLADQPIHSGGFFWEKGKKMYGNYTLKLLKKKETVYDTEFGERIEMSYVVQVNVLKMDGTIRSFVGEVPSDKVKNFGWVTAATFSLATIPKRKEEKEVFESMVQQCIETDSVETETVYAIPGWRNVKGVGWRYIYGDGAVGDSSINAHSDSERHSLDIKRNALGQKETFDCFNRILQTTPRTATGLELLLYLHASLMTTVFKEAGHPLQFLMGICGVTNSRKTSLALAVTKLFERNNLVADAEFATSTSCGIEKVLGRYKDAVTIVDDFKPGINTAQQKYMNQKLDELVRLEGNRVTKKRMTEFIAGGDKKFFPIHGACLITMELVEGVESTLSRMFISEISATDVDNNLLSFFQNNLWIVPTHAYDFIAWLTTVFEETVSYIRKNFEYWRRKYTFAYPRFGEMFASFMISANVYAQYAVKRNFVDMNQAQNFVAMTESALIKEFNTMGIRVAGKDKVRYLVKALEHIVSTGKIKPVSLEENSAPLRKEAYVNNDYLFVRATHLKCLISEYRKEMHEQMDIVSEEELVKLLEKMNLIEIRHTDDGSERTHKLPIQRGNGRRYIYMKLDVLNRLFEEE